MVWAGPAIPVPTTVKLPRRRGLWRERELLTAGDAAAIRDYLGAASAMAVVKKAPAAVVKKAPTAVVKKAPMAVVKKAPVAVVKKAPIAVVKKAPTVVVKKAPTAVVKISSL